MLFFIIVLIISLMIWGITSAGKDLEKKIEKYRQEGLEYINVYFFQCLGGFKDIGACKSCYIELFKDRIRIKLYKKSEQGTYLGSKEAEVMITDIIDMRLESESQLIERVSLGNMVVFGMLSFAMKGKQAELQREVLVLTFNYENEVVNLVLAEEKKDTNDTFKLLQEINSLRIYQEPINQI